MDSLTHFNLTEYPARTGSTVVGVQLTRTHEGHSGTSKGESYIAWAGIHTFQDGRAVHINSKVRPGTPLYDVAERWCRVTLDRLGIQSFELREMRSETPSGIRVSIYVRDMVSYNPEASNRFVAFFRSEVTPDGRRETHSFVLNRHDVPVEAVMAAEEWIGKLEQDWSER